MLEVVLEWKIHCQKRHTRTHNHKVYPHGASFLEASSREVPITLVEQLRAAKSSLCDNCRVRPAVEGDILCRECSERYATFLHSAREKTSQANVRIATAKPVMEESSEPTEDSRGHLVQTTPGLEGHADTAQVLESPLGSQRRRTRAAGLVGYMLLGIGLLALAVSIVFSSTVLAFIGLGLTFFGMLMFFIRPHNYARSDLLNATAMSSLKTIDNIMLDMGYHEKGVYIPTEGSDRTVVFVPTEPSSATPTAADVAGKTSLTDPAGLVVVPPGLALANLIEKKLGFKVKDCGVETLIGTLPKVLIDLEIARDIQAEVKGDRIEFKLIDSIYADFCREVRDSSRRCGLGCPMCSAIACILATASGKPVLLDEDREPSDRKTTTSSYQLLTQPRIQ